MLSDEEKEAVEYFKDDINYLEDALNHPNFLGHFITIRDKEFQMLKILVNLIEKQSKEIEELSDKLTEKICKGVEEEILEEYRQTIINKDKEIEELKEKNRQGKMRIVQLENEITARIEDVNQYYTPNDKIKAIIEELAKQDRESIMAHNYLVIPVLESLLEKE